MADTAEEGVAPDFLAGCFFLVDEASRSETTPDDELVLYFYPDNVPLRTKVMINGCCVAILSFASQFTSEAVQSMSLDRYTLCFRNVGRLTLVLSGPVEEPITALTRRLERVATWFRFFHGSFEAVSKQCATRKEICALFKDIGDSLVAPLDPTSLSLVSSGPVTGAVASNMDIAQQTSMAAAALATVFHPLPKAECSPRQFILASQLLNIISTDPKNLAGCIFAGRAVLFSQLDIATTDAIAVQALATFKEACKSQRSTEFAPFTELRHVYLTRTSAEALAAASRRLRGQSGGDDWLADTSRDVPADEPGAPPLVPLGLFVYVTKRSSLAILMSPEALDDQKHIKSVQKTAKSELLAIENGVPSTGDSLSDAIGASASDPSPLLASSDVAALPNSGGPGSSGSSGSGAIAAMSQGVTSGDNSCPWILSDELMGVLSTGTAPLVGVPPAAINPGGATPMADDMAFKDLIGVAHDALADPDVTQVFLRRRTGAVLSRRLFAKELHWYVPSAYASGIQHEKLVEIIERSRNIAFCENRDGQLF